MVAPAFNVVSNMPVTASNYIVIDIETGNPSNEIIDDAIDRKIAGMKLPMSGQEINDAVLDFGFDWTAPANMVNEEKIAERKASAIESHKNKLQAERETAAQKLIEAADKARSKAALMDSAPIICACCKSESQAIAFNGMSQDQFDIAGWSTIGCADEKGMLIALRTWLDSNSDQHTQLVGHNLRHFDKPKLRNRYAFHRLKLPQILRIGQGETFDTMQLAKHFSVERNRDLFVSLDDLCWMLDIEQPKQIISGKEVPGLHAKGEYELILTYCCIDTISTERAYTLMTSTATDLE